MRKCFRASDLAQRRSTSRGAALADGIGRLAERFAGLARRSGYPHSETPGAVPPFIGIPYARYVP
jgi:hypothetical protein